MVLDDADLDAAAAAASFGAFMHAGQICMSTERIVVDKSVQDELVAKLAQRADALTAGSPFDEGTMVGPVVTEQSSQHVTELIEDARAKGATIAAGGTSEGVVHRPTVITGVTPDMRIYGEESFGPVVTVVTADGVDDAVRIANDTEYGLSAAVFGQDTDRALGVASRIQSGICHVNGVDRPRRARGTVRRRQTLGLGTLRLRPGRRRVHDPALDHHLQRGPPLPDLSPGAAESNAESVAIVVHCGA